MGETAVQARYVVNSRKHSYYTFCCSVSPDSLSLSLPSASHSFSLHSSLYCLSPVSPYPTHTPTYVPVCMCSHSHTHTHVSLSLSVPSPSHRLPLSLPPALPKVSRYSKLSRISLTGATFTTISSFILWN